MGLNISDYLRNHTCLFLYIDCIFSIYYIWSFPGNVYFMVITSEIVPFKAAYLLLAYVFLYIFLYFCLTFDNKHLNANCPTDI